MSTVAIITDQHFGCRADSPVFLDYFEMFYHDVFFPHIIKNNIKEVIDLGDTFDRRKYVNFQTLKRAREMWFDVLFQNNIKLYCLLGNHTTYHKNNSSVNAIRELIGKYPNVIVYEKVTEVIFNGTKVLFVPWINDGNQEDSLTQIKKTDAEICMGHLELKGFLMNRGQKSEIGFDSEIFNKFKLVVSGHYHHKSNSGNVFYLGSPGEMTFADINDPRGFHTWETNTTELDFYKNPFKMFYKIFYDDKDQPLPAILKKVSDKYRGAHVKVVVQNRTNPAYFDKFMERLFSMQPADIKIEEDMADDGSQDTNIDMAEDTLTILNKYVDTLEIDIDKDKIKEELRLLHVEAINMER